jgi:hypothetical protein
MPCGITYLPGLIARPLMIHELSSGVISTVRMQAVGKPGRVDQGEIDVDHHEMAVDVDAVSGQIDDQQLRALAAQDIRHLRDGLVVDPDAAADDGRLGVQPGEAAALHHAGAGDGREDRHAGLGQGAGHVTFLAVAQARREARDDGAALHGERGVARVARLEPTAGNPLEADDLDAVVFQHSDQAVVLGLHLRERRDLLRLPIPAGFQVAEAPGFLDRLRGVDHLEFRPGAVDQDRADPADIVVARPQTAAMRSG